MADKEKILAALAQLDPLDDDQWTADGAPKVETVSGLVGESVKRQDIVNAAPDFNREKAGQSDEDEGDQNDGNEDQQGEGGESGDTDVDPDNPDPDGTAETGEGGEQPAKADGETVNANDPDPEDVAETDTEFEAPSREMTTGEFLSWLRTVPKEELENVEKALKDQNDSVGAEIKELQELQKRISRAVSMTRNRIKEAFPNSPDQHAIRSFIQSQQAARAERVSRRNTILKGIRPEELDFRSPLDAAMARKTKRGTQRPTRPLVK